MQEFRSGCQAKSVEDGVGKLMEEIVENDKKSGKAKK